MNHLLTHDPDALTLNTTYQPGALARVSYTTTQTESSVTGDAANAVAALAAAQLFNALASRLAVSDAAAAAIYQDKAAIARAEAGLGINGAGCAGYFARPKNLLERIAPAELVAISQSDAQVTVDLLKRYIEGDLLLAESSDVRKAVISAYQRLCTALVDTEEQEVKPALLQAGYTIPYPRNEFLESVTCQIAHLSLFSGRVKSDEQVARQAKNARRLLSRLSDGEIFWASESTPIAKSATFKSKAAFHSRRCF